jgi:RecA-family ATPase
METVQQQIEEAVEFNIVWGENYLALPRDPQPWLIDKLVPSGGLMNLYGKPKLGKSYGALGIAHAIANESVDSFLGHQVVKHGKVVYLQVDTPRSEWAQRQERMVKGGYSIKNIGWLDANLVPYPVNVTTPVQ